MTRVVVAMSGGVDSSIAALEMKNRGYEPIGITMKTWPKEECGFTGERLCCSLEAIQFARSVAEDLEIPYYVINLSKEFGKEVAEYFADEYAKGRTPNPCIYCNSRIKFGYLFRKAKQIGAERIATGHYARILKKGNDHYLAEAKDKKKDQSYFLYDISKEVLPFVDFPLGEYIKEEVRMIALEKGFMTAEREESQDICFANAEGDYRKYLSKKGLGAFTEGDILDIKGNVIGRHNGIASYTVGQRKGLGVTIGEPAYVLKIDPRLNTIVIGNRNDAMQRKIRVSGLNWLIGNKVKKAVELQAKIRYASSKARARVIPQGDDEVIVEFFEPQFAPTPGQAAVFYDGEIVAGGGWIEEVLE